jgi:hypothetical protein
MGCSAGAGSLSPDARIAVTVPTDGAVACPSASGAASAPQCWATGRLTTRTGCSDTHCEVDGGLMTRSVNYAFCGISSPDAATDAQSESALADTAGALSLDDDLCEFHAIVVPECAGSAGMLYFDTELSTMTGGAVPAGAKPYIEAFASPTHLAPSTGSSTETTPGHYRIGPAMFDISGNWSVTLHFFGTCSDALPGSPHAHVTFTLQVP